MTPTHSDQLLAKLSGFITEKTGLYYPQDKFKNLERIMASATVDLGHQEVDACIRWILSSSDQAKLIKILAHHLTTGETYFFRDLHVFKALEYNILPELIHQRRQTHRNLKIWCAGCASGEEPYSVAILLDRLIPDLDKWQISILGTDINHQSLQKAKSAVYGNWSFRNAPSWFKGKYFVPKGNNQFQILPRIKKMVNFDVLNLVNPVDYKLAGDSLKPDIILCRNVLMYFDPAQTKRVIDFLYDWLTEDGWLIVSSTETSQELFKQYQTVRVADATFYRKDEKESRTTSQMLPVPEPSLSTTESKKKKRERIESPLDTIKSLYVEGRYDAALEKALAFHGENPTHYRAIHWLMKIYANLAKFEEALRVCEKCIANDKLNPGFYFLRATILQDSNRSQAAMEDLKKVLYLDPDFILAYFLMGNLNRQQDRIEESNRHFNKALSLLSRLTDEDPIPESEGMTAGNLKEYISIITRTDRNSKDNTTKTQC